MRTQLSCIAYTKDAFKDTRTMDGKQKQLNDWVRNVQYTCFGEDHNQIYLLMLFLDIAANLPMMSVNDLFTSLHLTFSHINCRKHSSLSFYLSFFWDLSLVSGLIFFHTLFQTPAIQRKVSIWNVSKSKTQSFQRICTLFHPLLYISPMQFWECREWSSWFCLKWAKSNFLSNQNYRSNMLPSQFESVKNFPSLKIHWGSFLK